MIFYFSLSVLFFLNIIICKFSKDKVFKYFMFFVLFLLLYFVSSLRVDIGIDYQNFEKNYYNLNKLSEELSIFNEPLYLLICVLFRFIGIPYCGVIFLISFFTLFPIFIISKENTLPIIFFYILFYQISFCLIQQFWAISITCFGVYHYYKKNKLSGVGILFTASLIHVSMFLFFILFIICQLLHGKKIISVITLCAVMLFFLFVKTNFFFDNILPFVLKDTSYFYYIGSKYFREVMVGTGLGVLIRYMLYFILIYLNFQYIADNKVRNTFYLLFCCLILADGLSLRIEIFQRLTYVFYPVLILIPSFITEKNQKKKLIKNEKKIMLFVAILLAILISLELPIVWGNIPYKHIKLI